MTTQNKYKVAPLTEYYNDFHDGKGICKGKAPKKAMNKPIMDTDDFRPTMGKMKMMKKK